MVKRNQTFLTEFLLMGFGDLKEFKILLFTVFLIIHVMAVSCNILVVALVVFLRSLHSPMYIFISQLSLSEIIFTRNIVPQMLWLILVGGGRVFIARCIFQFCLLAFPTVVQCLLLASMSFDRYQVQIICSCWLVGFTASIILYVSFGNLQFCGPNTINHFYCDVSPVILSTTGRQKAFSTCSSHLIVVCLYYGSLGVIYIFQPNKSSFNINKCLSLLYTLVTPLVNPLIYSLRNQEIRRVISKYIHF
uniref:G-protein coupled receptors family 1 profile domain-containing protein n=1 Tax=Pyxicephalus adspersus TaxID=30357 RepID=A0AAV3AW59_PYXAD|nr:TPA: hypothetical protein GDO54_005896 [Pyxicephalus adspersus]